MMTYLDPDPSVYPFEVLKRMTGAEKFALSSQLTDKAINQCRREIEQAHPGMTSREVDLKFIEMNYGAELAENVRLCLQARGEI